MNCIQWNLRYIRTINSCNNGQLIEFYSDMSKLPDAFTRKRYLWNLIRGKTFYINAADYVIENVGLAKLSIDTDPNHAMDQETNDLMTQTSKFVHDLLESEKDESVRRSFIWRIGKHVPFLTVDTVQYLSKDRVRNILSGDWVINDPALNPFIDEIRELRETNQALRDMITDLH